MHGVSILVIVELIVDLLVQVLPSFFSHELAPMLMCLPVVFKVFEEVLVVLILVELLSHLEVHLFILLRGSALLFILLGPIVVRILIFKLRVVGRVAEEELVVLGTESLIGEDGVGLSDLLEELLGFF